MRWSIMAATILCTTNPALAQRQGPPAPASINPGYAPTTGDIRRDIDQARDSGRLSRRDQQRARTENSVTNDLAERFAGDGRLSDDERREIDNRNAAARSILQAPATRSRGR